MAGKGADRRFKKKKAKKKQGIEHGVKVPLKSI